MMEAFGRPLGDLPFDHARVAIVGDAIVPRHRIRYTLSADHRIIDGALAAQFLQTLTRLIENPWTIIA